MDKSIKIAQFFCNDTDIEKIGKLYCTTFLPEGFSPGDEENVIKTINKHTNYEGFRGLKAKD